MMEELNELEKKLDPIVTCCLKGGKKEEIKTAIDTAIQLINDCAKISPKSPVIWNLFNMAVFKSTPLARLMIEKGLGVTDTQPQLRNTTLHLASDAGNIEIVKLVLASGANPQARNKDRYTARDCAKKQDHKDIVNLLPKNQLLAFRTVSKNKFLFHRPKTSKELSLSSRDSEKRPVKRKTSGK